MPVYTIETPSGKTLDIEAADEATAMRGAQEWHESQSGARKVGDLAGNAVDKTLGFTQDQVAAAEKKVRGAPSAAPSFMDVVKGAIGYGADTIGHTAREARRGAAMMLGTPFDLANAGLRYAGVPLPGKTGDVTAGIDYALSGFGAIPEPRGKPDVFQRIGGRVAQEVGASAVPVLAVINRARQIGLPAARAMTEAPGWFTRLKGRAYETAATDPAALVGRETLAAGQAGTGAGIANEAAGNPQHGENWKSDLGGSLAGLLLGGVAGGAGRAVSQLAGVGLNRPGVLDDVAQEVVANRLMDNSQVLQEALRRTGRADTTPLVELLRRPAPIEEAVPGYAANIGDRARDVGLMTFGQNVDALLPGAANMRRAQNEAAITARLGEIAPEGNAGGFRASLEAARARDIAAANEAADQAARAHAQATMGVQPTLGDATARGEAIRAAGLGARGTVEEIERAAWEPLRAANEPVDVSPLVAQFAARDVRLSPTETRAFRPAEAGDIAGMARGEGAVEALRPLRDVMGARSGLSDRLVSRDLGPNQARVVRGYQGDIDQFLENAMPSPLAEQYGAARAATREKHERFSRPGSFWGDVLAQGEGGRFTRDPSEVAARAAPTDTGRLTDFRDLLREAGTDQSARGAVADQVMSEAGRAGALDNPEKMTRFLSERSIVMREFPELSNRLQNVGFSKAVVDDMSRTAAETEKRLTTPGKSATASYLKYGDERTVDAIRTVTNAGSPVEATRELIAQAGGSPEARAGLRDAFWRDVKQSGKDSAKTASGGDKWNGRKLNDFLNDSKRKAVAEELWSDRPEELANIRQVFEALASAEGSSRTRLAGSSGTPAGRAAKFDAALSASSVASRIRSVERGQLSPTIAGIDLISTYLRRKKAGVMSQAIDRITSEVVNDPELAAVLLEKYNPAERVAKRRLLTQKFGARGSYIANLLDESQRDEGP